MKIASRISEIIIEEIERFEHTIEDILYPYQYDTLWSLPFIEAMLSGDFREALVKAWNPELKKVVRQIKRNVNKRLFPKEITNISILVEHLGLKRKSEGVLYRSFLKSLTQLKKKMSNAVKDGGSLELYVTNEANRIEITGYFQGKRFQICFTNKAGRRNREIEQAVINILKPDAVTT